MTELFIMDKNFEIISVLDDFSSLMWNPRFSGVGDWQLECSMKYYEDLKNAEYIGRSDDSETGIIIGPCVIQKDEIGAESLLIKGKFLKQILGDRVVKNRMTYTDETVENIILSLIEEFFIKNTPFSKLTVKRTGQAQKRLTTQITWGSALERIVKIEEEQGVACMVEYDPIADKIVCSVKEGTNRSQSQTKNDWVVFSEEFENIYDYRYTKIRQSKNFAIVAGAGEGKNRIVKTIDVRKQGESLKELFVDARDLQEEDEKGNKIPRDRYLKNLEQRGREKLQEYAEIQEIEAKVNTQGLLQYKKDYFLGDYVNFVANDNKIDATLRVCGINEEIEAGERRMEIVFGKEQLSLKDTIKREVI